MDTNKIIEEEIGKFVQEINAFNEEHKSCTAHDEGQYCHLDDEKDNDENIVPSIKDFLRASLTRVAKQAEKEGRIDGLELRKSYADIQEDVLAQAKEAGRREGIESVKLEKLEGNMRAREEIENSIDTYQEFTLILEVLLDIRDLLSKANH